MKPVYWNDGTVWGDPNVYWGSPSYRLEPGDPGYVPVPGSDTFTQTTKKKKNTMPKQDYIAKGDAAFSAQLTQYRTAIPSYATLLNVSAAQMAAQAADAEYFAYILACQQVAQGEAQQWTGWKDLERGGGTPPVGGAPVAPVFPTAVTAVPPGIEVRFRALVQLNKAQPGYNATLGQALGTEGAVMAVPAAVSFQPVLKLELVGGQVFIHWGWQGHSGSLDMLELQVDRGDGKGYNLLTYDTTPNYTDTTPLPATAAKWKYKGIYRVADARTGQWSDEVSITVGG